MLSFLLSLRFVEPKQLNLKRSSTKEFQLLAEDFCA